MPIAGGKLADWADARMMPRIRDAYQDNPAKVPFDFAEGIASLAPRAVFVSAPAQDPIMGVEGVKSAVAGAAAVYQLRKAGTALRAVHPSGGRDFTEAARGEAYAWLDQRFKR